MVSSIILIEMAAKNFKETKVYKLAYEQAMEIFELTKLFPKEEKFSLTDQVRRSHEVYVQILPKRSERRDTQRILH